MASSKNNHKADSFPKDGPVDTSRRNLIKGAGMVGVAALGTGAENIIAQESSKERNSNTMISRDALEVLTAEEAETLEAVCGCLIPSDENGPGAFEARAAHYIDKSLASHNKSARDYYMVSLDAINQYSRKTRGNAFHRLIDDHQFSILSAVQEDKVPGCSPSGGGFFNIVRNHTIDGTFCDPYYGGNRNFVGWDMLNYPGIRLSASETDVAQGPDLTPNHQSAYDHETYTKMVSNEAMNQRAGKSDA